MDKSGILFDMDGVLYQGDTPIPGAVEVIEWCEDKNIPFLFLTNTTSRPRLALVEKLAKMGINIAIEKILTPPVAACHWLNEYSQGPVALFVPDSTRHEFDLLDTVDWQTGETPAAVIIGDLGAAWDFNTLNSAFRLLMQQPQPRLIALGLTRYWLAEDGLRLDTGPYVKALEYASGQEAAVMGKPAKHFFTTALQLLELSATDTIMIGDDIRADIDAAQHCEIAGVLVKTGKFRAQDLELGITPYAVLDSVADLPTWWHTH